MFVFVSFYLKISILKIIEFHLHPLELVWIQPTENKGEVIVLTHNLGKILLYSLMRNFQIHFGDWYPEHFWNYYIGEDAWLANIGSSTGLVPSAVPRP